jgi:hypothetical protein
MGWKNFNTDNAKKAVNDAHERAVSKTLDVIGEASRQQVPFDEGTLANTLFKEVRDGVGIISFGGGEGTGLPRVPYAIRWHEDTANFQRGRKNQYLRDPFNALVGDTYRRAIAMEKL